LPLHHHRARLFDDPAHVRPVNVGKLNDRKRAIFRETDAETFCSTCSGRVAPIIQLDTFGSLSFQTSAI